MKNVVFGVHVGGHHDRRSKVSVYAFMYGRTSELCSYSSTSIFEKKTFYRDEGFIVRLKAPVVTARRFFGDGDVGRGVLTTIKDYAHSMGSHLRHWRKK